MHWYRVSAHKRNWVTVTHILKIIDICYFPHVGHLIETSELHVKPNYLISDYADLTCYEQTLVLYLYTKRAQFHKTHVYCRNSFYVILFEMTLLFACNCHHEDCKDKGAK